jgi:hypothetical protein
MTRSNPIDDVEIELDLFQERVDNEDTRRLDISWTALASAFSEINIDGWDKTAITKGRKEKTPSLSDLLVSLPRIYKPDAALDYANELEKRVKCGSGGEQDEDELEKLKYITDGFAKKLRGLLERLR